jgi:hypothetical protein
MFLRRMRPNLLLVRQGSSRSAPAYRKPSPQPPGDALFQLSHRISYPRAMQSSRTLTPSVLRAQGAFPHFLPPGRHTPIRLPPALQLARCTSRPRAQGHPRTSPPPTGPITFSLWSLSAPSRRVSAHTRAQVREDARIRARYKPGYMRAMMADMRQGPTSATSVAMQGGAPHLTRSRSRRPRSTAHSCTAPLCGGRTTRRWSAAPRREYRVGPGAYVRNARRGPPDLSGS